MSAPKLMFTTSAEVKAYRKQQGMNQDVFWSRIGITQSGGSRYESGRNIPETVRLLLHLAYAPADRSQRLLTSLRSWRAKQVDAEPASELPMSP